MNNQRLYIMKRTRNRENFYIFYNIFYILLYYLLYILYIL